MIEKTKIVQIHLLPKSNAYLYFTTDEEIKGGDNAISLNGGENGEDVLFVAKNITYHKTCRKIVATTDKSIQNFRIHIGSGKYWDDEPKIMKIDLSKPMVHDISQSFIEEYYKKGGIDKVLLEYTDYKSSTELKGKLYSEWHRGLPQGVTKLRTSNTHLSTVRASTEYLKTFNHPKTDEDNCVITHPVKSRVFTYDDITHALAYGYGGRRDGLSHLQTLVNFKESGNL